jgi:hypothetical protein
MKRIFIVGISLLSFMIAASAQVTDSFDISTFTAPKGWAKQAGPDSIQFSIEEKDGFCLITLYKSVQGFASPKENFDAAWATIVKEAVTISAAPQMLPTDSKGEWLITGGFAPFESGGAKGVALLFTATAYGKMVNAVILTNTQAYEAATDAFLNSITFKTPAVQLQPQTPVSASGGPSLVNNFWKYGGIRQGMLGHTGLSTGSFAKTYQFFPNGTYKFYREDMQLAAPKYYLEKEEGTYTVSGNTITVTPKKASYSQHRLSKDEPPIKSGPLALSTAQYRFEFWRYDDNWRLLLSPVDGNETKRDGSFSFYRNGEAQRTYQYHQVDATGKLMQ